MLGRQYRFGLPVALSLTAALAPVAAWGAITTSGSPAVLPSSAQVQATTPSKPHEPAGQRAHRLTARANFAPEKTSRPRVDAGFTPRVVAAPQPPFTQCPAVGADTSCGVVVQVSDSGTTVYSDPTQGPYDGADDTLVGVINATSKTIPSISLSSDTGLFGFDGDGLCVASPAPAGCPFGTSGYEGPNTRYSDITPDTNGGIVNFTGGLPPAATAYFSLEQPLTATAVFGGGPATGEQGAAPNGSEQTTVCSAKQPVNCATGVFFHGFNDLSVPGRGIPLDFSRTYASSAAASDGSLGFGWTHSYNMSLAVDAAGNVTITQENGATVPFVPKGSGGYNAPPRVLAALVRNGDGTYTFTRKAGQVRYVFSTAGQLTSETDANGYTTALSYKGTQLSSVTDPAGRKLSLTYNGAHISRVTDPLGRAVSFAYDPAGNLVQATDPAARSWKFTYDPNHLLQAMADPRNGVIRNAYDSSSRVISQVDAAGLKTSWAYTGNSVSPSGGVTTMTDEHGNVMTHNYANLELTSITHGSGTPAAATTSFTYDPATLGRTSVTDPNGHITKNTYDSNGNLLTTTDPLGNITAYSYNGFSEITRMTTPRGESTSLNYDGGGNLTRVTDPAGKAITMAYTDAQHPGDVSSVTDRDGRVKTMTYDGYGDTTSTTTSPSTGVTNTIKVVYDVDGEPVCQALPNATAAGVSCSGAGMPHVANTATWSHDAVGRPTAITDPANHTTTYAYDAAGNLIAATDALGNVTATNYDADNRPVRVTKGAGSPAPSSTTTAYDRKPGTGACSSSVVGATYCTTTTDPNGHVSVDYFSTRDQLLSEVHPGGQTTTYAYDTAGNEIGRTDAASRTTTYTYDADNRPTSITYSDGKTPKAAYSYDADSRRASMVDGTGTTTYAYDVDGRLASATTGAGSTVTYGHDGTGNLTSITYPGNKTVSRAFDNAGRLAAVTDWNSHVAHFGYDANGNLVNVAYPNGDTIASRFDPDNQLTSSEVAPIASPNSPLAQLSDTRNADELVTQETGSGATSGASTYTYDAKLQLSSANRSAYTYDLAGNPTKLAGAVRQTFDSADQLTSATAKGSSTTYSFDRVGNRATAKSSNGASLNYSYDQANRLTSVVSTAPPPAPVVTSLSPTSGQQAGGTAVTITGSSFTGATAVRFGSRAAKFTLVSDTSITATAPAGEGAVDVRVTSSAGLSGIVPADRFTYVSCDEADRGSRHARDSGSQCDGGGSTAADGAGSSSSTAPSGASTTSVAAPTTIATYGYNGDGLRSSKQSLSGSEQFTWDVSGGLPLLLVDGSVSFIYGPGGLPIEQVDGNGNATYFFHDQLGSTRALLGANGALTATFTYDAYGRTTATTNRTANTPLLYAGGYNDSESGLYYLRARYYDPTTGNFLTRDPMVAKTRSPYAYVGGNPLNRTDPSGLYDYQYTQYVGSVSELGSATNVMSYLQTHMSMMFPFSTGQCDQVQLAEACDLGVGPLNLLPAHVVIIDVGADHFTFLSVHPHIAGPGGTITFCTYEHDGSVFLQETAHAPNANPVENFFDPGAALSNWNQMAQNLYAALRPPTGLTGSGDPLLNHIPYQA